MTNRVTGVVSHKTNNSWRSGANLPLHISQQSSVSIHDRYSGNYRITELVYYNGELARRRLKLFVKEGHGFRFIRETWSDSISGRYYFNNIAPGKYLVLADDYLAQKNAVVADLLDSERMP